MRNTSGSGTGWARKASCSRCRRETSGHEVARMGAYRLQTRFRAIALLAPVAPAVLAGPAFPEMSAGQPIHISRLRCLKDRTDRKPRANNRLFQGKMGVFQGGG